MNGTASPGTAPALLTKVEAAKRLRVSVRTLDRLGIPRVNIVPGKVLYRPETIDRFVAEHEQPAPPQG